MFSLLITKYDLGCDPENVVKGTYDVCSDALDVMCDYFRRHMPSYNVDPTTGKPHPTKGYEFTDSTFGITNDMGFDLIAHIKKVE